MRAWERGYLAIRPEVESLRVQSFVVSKSFTLKGGARNQFINSEQQGTLSPALYSYSAHYVCSISPKHGSNDFMRSYIEHVM